MVPFSRAFLTLSIPSLPNRSFPPTFQLLRSKRPSVQNMSTFSSTLNGYPANTLFDCQSPISWQPIPLFQSSAYCSSTGKSWHSPCGHDNGCFFCLVNLLPRHVHAIYDLTLGRDWFNYCTTSVPDAQILLLDDMRLFFSSSPFPAVHPHHICEFLLL